MGDFVKVINGHTLEYFDDCHCYLADGVIVPSVTQMLKTRFGGKYDGISTAVLNRAAQAGTAVHEAIERYCETGEQSELPEVRNFAFLQSKYKFYALENEIPVLLFDERGVLAAGRVDLVLGMNGEIGGADIKRTAVLDKDYLACQLNIYRIAYRQSYGVEWDFLRGIHLRNNIRRFVQIPIDEQKAWQIVNEWRQANESD